MSLKAIGRFFDYVTDPDQWRLSPDWYGVWPFSELGRLRELAYRDPLTGAYNRNAYHEMVDGRMARTSDGSGIAA